MMIVLLMCELFMRIYLSFKQEEQIVADGLWGWRTLENYQFTGFLRDDFGDKYWAKVTTNRLGFRLFGNIDSGLKKLMVIGDSYTHAPHISDDKTYYNIISRKIPIEVFAYGSNGYGTLQEFMVIDKYIDTIKPDFIIIQLCSNDFIDNSYELDRQSTRCLQGMPRPYLLGNHIVIKNPRNCPWLWNFATRYSRFLYYLLVTIERVKEKFGSSVSIEDEIIKEGRDHKGFKKAAIITQELLSMIRKRSAQKRVFAFCVDSYSPCYVKFRDISKESGIELIDGVPQAIRKMEEKGMKATIDGWHWNELGHRICAEVLVEYLTNHGAVFHK